MLAREEGKVGGGKGGVQINAQFLLLDDVIRNKVFCVGEVIVEVFLW